MPVAYSYIRFSDIKQRKGDSRRRQTEVRDAWLGSHPDAILDTSLVLVDDGVSAHTGEHRTDKHCLGQFLELVRRGSVAKGSYLLIENLDRLSREEVQDGLELILGLLRSGIVIVQLVPVATEYRYPAEPMKIMMMVMELNRGNSESVMKVERLSKVWQERRRKAAAKQLVISRKVPGWVRVNEQDKMVRIPAKVAMVHRIFRMSLDGNGASLIAQTLNKEGAQRWGRDKPWNESVVYHLLTDRKVLGEYQPTTQSGTKGKRVPVGEPIPGYYPAAIDETTFLAAQAAIAGRNKTGGGRRGKHVNLFAGLLQDARDGGTITYMHNPRRSVLINVNGRLALISHMPTFSSKMLEYGILQMLNELSPADVLPASDLVSEAMVDEGRLAQLDRMIANMVRAMGGDDSPEVFARIKELELERAEVRKRVSRGRAAAASPTAEAWRTLKGEPLKETAGRLRYQAAIRRLLERVVMVVRRRGHMGYAWCELVFVGGAVRTVLIQSYQGGQGNIFRLLSGTPRLTAPGGAELAKAWSERKCDILYLDGVDELLAGSFQSDDLHMGRKPEGKEAALKAAPTAPPTRRR